MVDVLEALVCTLAKMLLQGDMSVVSQIYSDYGTYRAGRMCGITEERHTTLMP